MNIYYLHTDIVGNIKSVARHNVDLTLEERMLLSIGFKNTIRAKRASWRKVSSIELNEGMIRPRGKLDRKSTRLNSSHSGESRMPSSA